MLKHKPVTAIVPARGGSKGLPGKNLLRLAGDTLTARAARFALAAPAIDRVIVSSDDEAILRSAEELAGVETHKRPPELATDEARTGDVVAHLIDEAGIEPGYLLLLQPTSPLRSLADIEEMFAVFELGAADAAVSVCLHEEPRPEKLQRIANGYLAAYLGKGFEGPRQSLPDAYALNGAFYLVQHDVFLEDRSFLPEKTMAYVMPPERSANIDSETDWQILQAMLKAGHWNAEEYG